MADFSLVPVDYQPDFDDFSLVPVDHDPFGDSGGIVQPAQTPTQTAPAQTQPAQALPQSLPQQPATGTEVSQSDIGMPGVDSQSTNEGESWDPDSENSSRAVSTQPNQTVPISQSGKLPVDPERLRQFGELKMATFTPTQQIGYLAADALMALGMKPYFANDLTSRFGNVLNLTPLGLAGSALDLIDAKRRDDLPGVLTAAAGMIPGAKGAARGVAEAIERHHPWSKYLGGAVKQELVALPRSLHLQFHRELDEVLPRSKGTAFYKSRSPTERQEDLQQFAKHTKEFDAKHGTKLYDALLKNGFPAP
jgi:hypothetical protein